MEFSNSSVRRDSRLRRSRFWEGGEGDCYYDHYVRVCFTLTRLRQMTGEPNLFRQAMKWRAAGVANGLARSTIERDNILVISWSSLHSIPCTTSLHSMHNQSPFHSMHNQSPFHAQSVSIPFHAQPVSIPCTISLHSIPCTISLHSIPYTTILTSDLWFGPHPREVLRPERGNRPPQLKEGGVLPIGMETGSGIVDYLLSLNLVSDMTLGGGENHTTSETELPHTSSLAPLLRNLVPANSFERLAIIVR